MMDERPSANLPSASIRIENFASGLQNMQRDLSLWQQAEANGNSYFFSLRLYGWSGPTISYGFAQKVEQLFDYEQLQRDGVAIVARSTGGRALLHHHELTYALAASLNHPLFGGSLLHSYQKVAGCLCRFLEDLKIGKEISVSRMRQSHTHRSSMEQSNPSEPKKLGENALCYLSTGFMEVKLDGRKLIGSAQKRGRVAYLQHGSIPIEKSPYRIVDYLIDKKAAHQEPDVAVLSDYLDTSVFNFDFLAHQLANTFVQVLEPIQTATVHS